ncbi:MAG: type II toxin-antitoxin system VapC family toxin [Candidatus Aminicenantes bacterium]
MNIVDSSGWLEYFSDGPNSDEYEEPLSNREKLIVPSICLYEVFKAVLRERDENSALQSVAVMHQGKIVDLNTEIAVSAVKISLKHKIPMADSIILSTGYIYNAVI